MLNHIEHLLIRWAWMLWMLMAILVGEAAFAVGYAVLYGVWLR